MLSSACATAATAVGAAVRCSSTDLPRWSGSFCWHVGFEDRHDLSADAACWGDSIEYDSDLECRCGHDHCRGHLGGFSRQTDGVAYLPGLRPFHGCATV